MPLASLLLALILSLACQANAAPASGEFIENAELFQAIRDRDYILIAYLLRNEIPLGPLNGRENGYSTFFLTSAIGTLTMSLQRPCIKQRSLVIPVLP